MLGDDPRVPLNTYIYFHVIIIISKNIPGVDPLVRSIWYRRTFPPHEMVPKKLDPQVRNYWFISLVSSVCLLLLIFTPVFYIISMVYGEMVYMGLFVVIGASISSAALWSYAAYPHFSYRVCEDGLEIRQRYLRKKSSFLPYDSIAELKVSQNLFERLFGLKTIYVRTVGWDDDVSDTVIQGTTNPYAIINKVELASDISHFPAPVEPTPRWVGPSSVYYENPWGYGANRSVPCY